MNCRFDNSEYTGSIIFSGDMYLVQYDDTGLDFQYSEHFNGYVQVPKGIKNCGYMFNGCYDFNQPILIPSGVIECYNMFQNCTSLSYPITFPKTTTDIRYALQGCINVPDVYILNDDLAKKVVIGLVKGHENASKDITIHCRNINVINGTASSESVTGTYIAWDENWYSAEYKILLTTDMNGVI